MARGALRRTDRSTPGHRAIGLGGCLAAGSAFALVSLVPAQTGALAVPALMVVLSALCALCALSGTCGLSAAGVPTALRRAGETLVVPAAKATLAALVVLGAWTLSGGRSGEEPLLASGVLGLVVGLSSAYAEVYRREALRLGATQAAAPTMVRAALLRVSPWRPASATTAPGARTRVAAVLALTVLVWPVVVLAPVVVLGAPWYRHADGNLSLLGASASFAPVLCGLSWAWGTTLRSHLLRTVSRQTEGVVVSPPSAPVDASNRRIRRSVAVSGRPGRVGSGVAKATGTKGRSHGRRDDGNP